MSLIEIVISDLCKKVTWYIESEVFIVEMTSGLFKIEKKSHTCDERDCPLEMQSVKSYKWPN